MNIVAIDVGLKRVGAALCVYKNIITPLNAIIRKNRNQASNDVDKLLEEWKADILVVGLPKDGSEACAMQIRIKHFVSMLNFKNKIVFQEEDLSSCEAKLKIRGEIKEKRDGRIDSIAASIILERYLQHITKN